MGFKAYDPKKVGVTVGGIAMRAFADGSMVNFEYDEDESTVHNGTDGQGRHVMNAVTRMTITIRLAGYSPSNAILSALHKAKVPFPIIATDKSSNSDVAFADSCMVRKRPNWERSNEATMNEWIFNAVRGEIFHSGAQEV